MTLAAGQSLAHYQILGPLGAGGMGEVWRARDTRLDREVAIKILPEELADDEERLRRFEREAKTLASLSHANLAHVYGIDQVDDTCFIAMELVPGEDLAARLARGPLPVDEALDVCRQVAEGLEAAHEAGVVHRDLKPANVRITPEGAVKILDFGLAKPLRPRATEDGTTTAESDSFRMTEEGLVLGTPTYMSPEQARGKPVDRRTDIWAFGCVLFECLTGTRPFGGESLTDILAAIVEREPDYGSLPTGTPPGAQRILERCLDKDARTRLRDVGEARIALGSGGDEAPSTARRPRVSGGWGLAGAVLGLALGWSLAELLGSVERPVRSARPARTFELSAPGIAADGFGGSISPDGRHVAYVGEGRIRLLSLESAQAWDLDGTRGAELLCWSPESDAIAYVADAWLWRVPRQGGEPRRICALSSGWVAGAGLAWGPGGRIVFAPGFESLYEVSANGGEARELLVAEDSAEEHFHRATFLPEAKGLVYARHGPDGVDSLEVLAGGERRTILRQPGTRIDGPCWSPTGHVLFQREYEGTGIWALPFSLERLEATGEPVLVASGTSKPTVSNDGTLSHSVTGTRRGDALGWVDSQGVVEAFSQVWEQIRDPALSPDGQYVAATVRQQDSNEVYVHDIRRGTWTRLTNNGKWKMRPRWTPGGDIVYSQARLAGGDDLLQVPAAGTGEPVLLIEHASDGEVSRDGRWMVFEGPETLLALDLDAGGEPLPLVTTESGGTRPTLSPNGRWVAYRSTVSGRPEVYLQPFPSGEGRWQVSVATGRFPFWSPEGDRLFFTEQSAVPTRPFRLLSVSVEFEPELSLGVPEPLFEMDGFYATDFDPVNQRFLAVVQEREEAEVLQPLRLTLDWAPADD